MTGRRTALLLALWLVASCLLAWALGAVVEALGAVVEAL